MPENTHSFTGSMTLRSFRTEDTEKALEFHERVLRRTGTFVPGPWNDDMKNIEEVYIRPGGCFVLIEAGASIIAMGALKMISDQEAEIKRMRVEPSRQRQGLGQRVLDHLLSHAKKRGIKRVILDTTELQIPAQRFYEKNQFVEYGRDTWGEFKLILYEKWLG